MPFLVETATAVPPHRYAQDEVRALSRDLFASAFRDIDRLLKAFDQSGVQWRHFCQPAAWYLEKHPFSVRNTLYLEQAVELGAAAAETCLKKAGVAPESVTDLWWVSSTGLATPSPDVHVSRRLGLPGTVRRTPVWGLGCAGGAVGLSRGSTVASANPEAHVLVVAVELCSLTFLAGDRRKSNFIATVLFADGAAAALILGDTAYRRWAGAGAAPGSKGVWKWVGSHSVHWPDTLEMMGWEVGDDGWRVVFSRDIPEFLRRQNRELFVESDRPIDHWVVHPGGAKVLSAYEAVLGVDRGKLDTAYDVLRNYGNMSAPTVIYVLENLTERRRPQSGDRAALLALGPGFSSERVILEWTSSNSFPG